MWAAFDQKLDLWVSGTLSATFGEWRVEFGARVQRIDGLEAGLVFQGLSDKDRAVIKAFIDQSKGYLNPE